MSDKYIYRRDSRNGKVYKTKLKNKSLQIQEREKIYSWLTSALIPANQNVYVDSVTLYKECLKFTGLIITHKSFGMYLRYGLPKTNLPYFRVEKGGKQGLKTRYFGMRIIGILPSIQYFNLKEKTGYHTYQDKDFGFFNEDKLNPWVESCLLIDPSLKKNNIPSQLLFINFCNFYNLKIDVKHSDLFLWGRFLKKSLLVKYPCVKNVKRCKKIGSKINHYKVYTCIQFKNEKH